MQKQTTSSKPGIPRLIGAQLLGLVAVPVAVWLLWQIYSILVFSWLYGVVARQISETLITIVMPLILLLLLGLVLASVHFWVLKPWIARPTAWMVVSALAFPPLLYGLYRLTGPFTLHSTMQGCIRLAPNDLRLMALHQAVQLTAWVGALAGLAGGLLFGLAQGALLRERRRVWWLLSALAWAPVTAGAFWLANEIVLVFAQICNFL